MYICKWNGFSGNILFVYNRKDVMVVNKAEIFFCNCCMEKWYLTINNQLKKCSVKLLFDGYWGYWNIVLKWKQCEEMRNIVAEL